MTETRPARGHDTRRAIVREAVRIGAVEGLDRLTIGRLATTLGASKSGVFGLYGSKQELQLAAVEEAKATFIAEVIGPALRQPSGIDRLRTLCEAWLEHTRDAAADGACFFLSVGEEFASRPGRVRDAIVSVWQQWHEFHRQTIVEAQQLGEITADTDPAQLAFELAALERGAVTDSTLLDDPAVFDRARTGMLRLLREHATDPDRIPVPHTPVRRNG
ncbi:TetR/AcrR family transcriptional regulator [Nocardia sp. BMG51109]|uniref:TetR/AcrR family transcriptional regulator n=1 Tax=Nocardia sp. BMG51109 TaxID=1056816 RepID=UPI0004644840|nr:TetR family transcriptional regulator C-terminal domain-containing protein [Nocardia sp. BMG51109]